MEQHSEEWFKSRLGKITASMFEAVIGKTKGGKTYKAYRKRYLYELATQRVTGVPKAEITAKSLEHGNEHEPRARYLYELEKSAFVDEVGFISHTEFDFIGGSPDGLIDENGGLEIKCPYSPEVHFDTLINGMPAKNKAQVHGSLWITGREYWDFVSYCPSFPEELQLYIERIYPDEDYIAGLKAECLIFEDELQQLVNKLKGLIDERRK